MNFSNMKNRQPKLTEIICQAVSSYRKNSQLLRACIISDQAMATCSGQNTKNRGERSMSESIRSKDTNTGGQLDNIKNIEVS